MSIKPTNQEINNIPNELFFYILDFADPMDKRSIKSTCHLLSRVDRGIARLPPLLVRYALDFLTHGYADVDFRSTCTHFRNTYPLNAYIFYPIRGCDLPSQPHLDGIFAMYRNHSPIRLLGCNALGHVTDEKLARLQGLPLESLHIGSAAITDIGLRFIADLPLKTLNIRFNFSQISEDAFKNLSVLRLHSLILRSDWTKFTDETFAIFKNMPLQNLTLIDTSLTEKSLRIVKTMPLKTLIVNPLKCDHLVSSAEEHSKHLTETVQQQIPTLEECFIKAKL